MSLTIFFHAPSAAGRNYNTEAFDYNGSSGSGAEAPFWRAARSLPSSASSTPKKPFQPPRQRRSRFKEHLSPEEVEQGLKDGSLLQGVLRVNHKRMRLAYVSVEGFDKDVLIDGVFARNRAFEGDVVVIRLNDPSEWEVVKDDKDDEEDEAEPLGDDDDEVDEDLIIFSPPNKRSRRDGADSTEFAADAHRAGREKPTATLIVCPLSIMSNWEQQISQHVDQEWMQAKYTTRHTPPHTHTPHTPPHTHTAHTHTHTHTPRHTTAHARTRH